jgi:hypothetical protein
LERKTVKKVVSVPGGVDNGQQIRLSGEGQPGINGGPPGDIYMKSKCPQWMVLQPYPFPLVHNQEKCSVCAIKEFPIYVVKGVVTNWWLSMSRYPNV